MKRNLVRLFVALILSVSGFIGTMMWAKSGLDNSHKDERAPVAKLNESVNEVQRKQVQRVIWESVNRNDNLYAGEAIRTAANAEAKLLFTKNGTIIHLEPDSLVVLEDTGKGLSLDFLQGNMTVQSDGSGGDGLTLKTGSGEIKLKSADMSLSKNQNGQVDLEVYKGEAELLNGGQKLALNKDKGATLSESGLAESTDRLQVLNPKAGDTLLLNLSKGEKLNLAWAPLPAGYQVHVEFGGSRSALAPFEDATQPGETGKTALKGRAGKWFLRLKAVSQTRGQPELSSMVIPFTVEPKAPPSLAQPNPDLPALRKSTDEPVDFVWLNRHKFESQIIEVATDAQFKSQVFSKSLAGEVMELSAPLADGNYFWRVTGYLGAGDKAERLASAAVKFMVNSKWETKPPPLISPQDQQHLALTDIQKTGVPLRWQIPAGVKRFQVTVEYKAGNEWKPVLDQQTETGLVRLTDLKTGIYHWQVGSQDSRSGIFQFSTPFQFFIDDVPKLEWANAAPVESYEFLSPTPSLMAQWNATALVGATYRYKIAPEGELAEATPWQSTKLTTMNPSLPKEGRFQAMVEAVNESGRVLARTDIKIFDVKRRALLPAPQWASGTPNVFQSDAKGNLSLAWDGVNGANHYLLVLETPEGKVLEERPVERTTASLNRLKPGQYQVKLKSVDAFKRAGPDGGLRKVDVPNASDIRAPKFKSMKVK